MKRQKVLLVGKTDIRDYAGAKTIYMYNALDGAGVKTYVYNMDSRIDPPPGMTHSVFLPWVQYFDEDFMSLMKNHSSKRILYTDNFHWYDTCRMNAIEKNIDMDDFFTTVAFASRENSRWWPRDRFEHWGVCIDEDMAISKHEDNYIYVDQVWPTEWSSGIYSAKEVYDIAIPIIKDKYGVDIVSQKTEADWVDHLIDPDIELDNMLSVIAKAKVFMTSHEESLGLMQFESLVCGVPVVTNPVFSKSELMQMADIGVFAWNWPSNKSEDGQRDEAYVDIESASKEMVEAVGLALKSNRSEIRSEAIALYGKEAFVSKSGFVSSD